MSEELKLSTQFLADRHRLMAFIVGLVRHKDVAEDIFQDVWIKLARTAASGTTILDSRKWCRTVAKNLVLEGWRKRKSGTVLVDSRIVDLAEQAFGETDALQADWDLRHRALAECMKMLPAKSRELLELKYYHGQSCVTVARRLKRSYESVLMALSRTRRVLKQCVEGHLRPEDI